MTRETQPKDDHPVQQADHDTGAQREPRRPSDQADGGKQGICH